MRIFTCLVIAALTASAAHAADLPQAQPIAQAPSQAIFNWTGFYIGANAGYGSAAGAATLTALTGPAAGFSSRSTGDGIKGPLAGGQAGFNWQTGALVLGVEGDYQWANLNRSVTYVCGFACSISEKTAMTGFGTLRARVGAAFDHVLIYATAGGAWVQASDEATLTVGALSGQLAKISPNGFGWTAGGGVEFAIDRNWSVKGEYLYLSTAGLSGQGAVTGIGNVRLDIDAHAHIGRAGINYRF